MRPKLEPDSDPENFYQGQFEEELIHDKFNHFKKKIKKFRNELCFSERQSKDLFYIAVLYGLIFKLSEKKIITDESAIEKCVGEETFKKLKYLKTELVLDLLLPLFD